MTEDKKKRPEWAEAEKAALERELKKGEKRAREHAATDDAEDVDDAFDNVPV